MPSNAVQRHVHAVGSHLADTLMVNDLHRHPSLRVKHDVHPLDRIKLTMTGVGGHDAAGKAVGRDPDRRLKTVFGLTCRCLKKCQRLVRIAGFGRGLLSGPAGLIGPSGRQRHRHQQRQHEHTPMHNRPRRHDAFRDATAIRHDESSSATLAGIVMRVRRLRPVRRQPLRRTCLRRRLRPRVSMPVRACAWQMAQASASAGSGGGATASTSSRCTICCTCTLSALP